MCNGLTIDRTGPCDRDRKILAERMAKYDAIEGPRVGDFVEFSDGIMRRISYLWPESAQTSDGGSFYLGDGYVSMSGSLYPGVPITSLIRTGHSDPGGVWFFHHDQHQAHNGVHFVAHFRLYKCGQPAPK